MKRFFILILISSTLFNCKTKLNSPKNGLKEITPHRMTLDTIVHIMKENSLYTNYVDWNSLKKEINTKFMDNDSLSSLIKPIEYIFTELGDFHGFAVINGIQYRGTINRKRNVSYNYKHADYFKKMSNIYQETLAKTEIFSTTLSDSVAYIRIPTLINNYGNDSLTIEYTKKIRRKICELETNQPKGYIIDLRTNLGGTMWPIFSGLGELFPNIKLGGDTKDGKTFYSKWSLIKGSLHLDDYSIPYMPVLNCNIQIGNRKVAVLIGRYTSSSGEAVASGLKNLKNSKLFGETTAGASTTNSWFAITENVSVNPAIAYYMSLDYTVHKDGIIPDVKITEDLDLKNLTQGKVIDEAIKWILLPD